MEYLKRELMFIAGIMLIFLAIKLQGEVESVVGGMIVFFVLFLMGYLTANLSRK